jgi:hypothetical protein
MINLDISNSKDNQKSLENDYLQNYSNLDPNSEDALIPVGNRLSAHPALTGKKHHMEQSHKDQNSNNDNMDF